jgi:hypothetical protein
VSYLFLWRGDRRFGTLHLREDAELGRVRAVLLPETETVGLESLWQLRHPLFPGAPVTQRLRPPDIVADRHRPRSSKERAETDSPIIENGKPRGVPISVQYTVRHENGRVLPFETIGVLEVRPIPGAEEKTLGVLPRAALHRGSVWCVYASRLGL